jgi:hypothetical protein
MSFIAAAKRDDEITVIVNMKVDRLARIDIDFPKLLRARFQARCTDRHGKLDAAFRRFHNSKFTGHVVQLPAYFGSTAMALISIR